MNISDIERLLDNSATIETKIEILPRYAGESLITITNDDSIKSWEYADTRYVPDNGFIGMFVERTLEGELHNITTDFNIENREIILYLGIRVYDVDSKTYTTTFYSLGNFIVDKPESDEVKDNTKFTAKDYTIKFNINFNPDYTDDEYTKSFTTMLSEQGSVTALWLAKYTCKQCGVELGNEDFTNSDFSIDSNQFQNGEQCRDIIKAIAKLACSWARIDWDNKVYIDFYVKDSVEHDYNNITKDDYYELTVQKDTYGPINKVVFGSSIIEGDYSFVSDSESIASNGENSFVINDNPILYTEEIRERAVQNASTLLGLQYAPLEVETIGHPWLKGNELISVLDSADNLVYTYPLDRVIEYDGHIKTLITSYAPTKVAENYTYSGTGTSKNTQRQTKIILDRAEQKIQTLVEKTDEQSSKITSLTQDLDSVNITVSNVQKDLETTNSNLESTNNNVDNLQSQIQGVSADFEDFKDNEYVQSIDNLQKQIDGAIQFWNGADIPTLNNYPANEWITEADRINHQADIYTVIQDVEGELKQGKAYRFDKVDGVWQWIELTDNELSAVQEIAQNALKQANTNATDITTLKQTDTEIKANIEGIQLNYNTLNNQFDSTVITSKTIEGNPIHITDAGAYDLEKLYLEGNSYQETTNGNQLIDFKNPNKNQGYTTTTFEDNVLSAKSTGGVYQYAGWDITSLLQSNVGKTLCFKCDNIDFSNTQKGAIQINYNTDGTTYYYQMVTTDGQFKAMTITETMANCTTATLCIYLNNSGTAGAGTYSITIPKPMLYFGDITTPPVYEPYTNGASPNPEFPSVVEVIEGSVDVEVLGTNILRYPYKYTTSTIDGITFTDNKDGSITINGTCTATNYSLFFLVSGSSDWTFDKLTFELEPGTYTFKNTGTNKVSIPINAYKSDGTNEFFNITTTDVIKTFTEKVRLNPRILVAKDVTINNLTIYPMLVKGAYTSDTIPEYEKYKSTTATLDLQDNFIAKIGDVKDEIDVVSGKLTKRIGKVVLDGSENWFFQGVPSSNPDGYQFRTSKPISNLKETSSQTENHLVCDYFKSSIWYEYWLKDNIITQIMNIDSTNKNKFVIVTNVATTVEEFKNWLSQNNVTVYYVLAEPYEVQLDQTQITLFESINNISVSANLEPSYVATTYLTDSTLNGQYVTQSQLKVTEQGIESYVAETENLLQSDIKNTNTNLQNQITDVNNNLSNYATSDSVLTITNSVTNMQTSLNQQISITKDIQENGVSKVKTSTNYTFDEDGLNIEKTDESNKSTIDNNGIEIIGNATTRTFFAGYDIETGTSLVDTNNINVNDYMNLMSMGRFEKYTDSSTNKTGIGLFWTGD